MNLPDYILEAIKRIRIISRKRVRELFAGEYKSVFKGKGIEVEEVREYQPGDDISAIDWKTSARKGVLYVKKFREEREISLYLVVDASASMDFGLYAPRREKAAEAAALLSLAALMNNDRVGLLIFGEKEGKFVPPGRGRGQFLRIIREILVERCPGKSTDIAGALRWVYRVAKKRGTVVLISDFYSSGDFKKELRIVSAKHEVIGLRIREPAETNLYRASPFFGVDLETGEASHLWPSREKLSSLMEGFERKLRAIFSSSRADLVDVPTNKPAYIPIEEYFRRRA